MCLITYDLPGFGESDPHHDRNLNSSALDMLYLADALRVDKFWVVGFSGGGMHAWAALRYIPTRLAGTFPLWQFYFLLFFPYSAFYLGLHGYTYSNFQRIFWPFLGDLDKMNSKAFILMWKRISSSYFFLFMLIIFQIFLGLISIRLPSKSQVQSC